MAVANVVGEIQEVERLRSLTLAGVGKRDSAAQPESRHAQRPNRLVRFGIASKCSEMDGAAARMKSQGFSA